MAALEWDLSKVIWNVVREARRVKQGAEFLTDVERDTFENMLFMTVWLVHDLEHDLLPHFTDEELQPLRDWMRAVGDKRLKNRAFGYVLPNFTAVSEAERLERVAAKVVPIRPDLVGREGFEPPA